MYIRNDKTYLTYQDVKDSINAIGSFIKRNPGSKFHLFGVARGSFNLVQAISNQFNLPYTMLQYSTYDGNDEYVRMGFESKPIERHSVALILDDIADSGNTIRKTIEFINNNILNIDDTKVFTTIGNSKHDPDWMYYFDHNDFKHKWIVFPYENNEIHEVCQNCQNGEVCNTYPNKTHCNNFNKSFDNNHSCRSFN